MPVEEAVYRLDIIIAHCLVSIIYFKSTLPCIPSMVRMTASLGTKIKVTYLSIIIEVTEPNCAPFLGLCMRWQWHAWCFTGWQLSTVEGWKKNTFKLYYNYTITLHDTRKYDEIIISCNIRWDNSCHCKYLRLCPCSFQSV